MPHPNLKIKKNYAVIFLSRRLTDEVKRSFTKWLSGSEATPSFPTRPRKRAAAIFSRACRMTPNEVKQSFTKWATTRKRAKRVLQ